MPVRGSLVILPIMALALSACAHSMIPNTGAEDTEENREIFRLIQNYKDAMESLDANAVMTLVSPRFYESNGNTDKADDYDFNGLKSGLTTDFDRCKRMLVDFRIDNIIVEDEHAFAYIQFTYRAQNEFPTGLKWDRLTDRTRIEFEQRDGGWLITRGL